MLEVPLSLCPTLLHRFCVYVCVVCLCVRVCAVSVRACVCLYRHVLCMLMNLIIAVFGVFVCLLQRADRAACRGRTRATGPPVSRIPTRRTDEIAYRHTHSRA